jgi:DNA primase
VPREGCVGLSAAMIKQEKILEVRDRASIVEVISDYVTLKKAGRNYMGLCPFHAEKTPSFTVSEEKEIFHCFGCGAGGSIFNFLMQYEQLSFPEAVERVAQRYGITVERSARSDGAGAADSREPLYRVNECAATNYHQILFHHPAGRKALEYLKSRGVEVATAKRFLVVYAPANGSGLLNLVRKEKLSTEDALRLGLVGQRDGKGFYEKFCGRLMFPIMNAGGKVIAFGGRVLGQGLPKYLNSSDSPLFNKGSTLYGVYQAKEGIRKADRVIVVEGYLDVIALQQYGVNYPVATLGTALTVNHVRTLARYTKNIIALFDGDEAGWKAAARSFEIFIEAGLLGRAAFLAAGDDPDTFVRSRGREAVEKLIEGAVPLADYYFSWLERRYGHELEGKSRTAAEISRLLVRMQNAFEVDLLVRRAVDRLGIREELLRRPFRVANRNPSSKEPSGGELSTAVRASRGDMAERSLIGLMLRFPSIVNDVVKQDGVRDWIGVKWRGVVDVILAEWHEHGKIDVLRVAQRLDPGAAAEIAALTLEGEQISEAESDKVAHDCLFHLCRKYLRGIERNLRLAIRAAEEQNDEKAKRERILEWQDVVRKERQLELRKFQAKATIR